MTLPTRDYTSVDWALGTARRAAGDDRAVSVWTDDAWLAELANHTLTVDGVTYINPYAAALVFVSNPQNVAQRSEGNVSESYTPPYLVIQQLEKLATGWAAEVNALTAVTSAPEFPDLSITVIGWGN